MTSSRPALGSILQARQEKVRSRVSSGHVLLTDPSSVYYTTGRTDLGLVVLPENGGEPVADGAARELLRGSSATVAAELGHLTLATMREVQLDRDRLLEEDIGALVRDVRTIKDQLELLIMGAVAGFTADAFAAADRAISQGSVTTELDVERVVWQALKEAGADGWAYDPHVATGPRSAVLWAGVTTAELHGSLVVDAAGSLRGYRADMTRTWDCSGGLDGWVRSTVQVLVNTRDEAVQSARPGARAADVARSMLAQIEGAGLAAPPHAVGHGIGLSLHERPHLHPASPDLLEAGQVVMIEPATYDRSAGRGARIEDMYVVTEEGLQALAETKETAV